MQLARLLDNLPGRLAQGDTQTVVTDLTDDSRQVRPGALFIARPGHAGHGHDYIGDAIAQGAAAVIAATPPPCAIATPDGQPVAWVVMDRIDQTLAATLAHRFFDRPADKLRLVGITGTNGKTTTAYLVKHFLESAGLRCGMIGTIVIDDGQQAVPAELTTPGAIALVRLLAAMVRHGCQAAVMEVSSHALHQGRVAGIDFDVAVFTNLTGDHLDYHGDMDRYADAKAALFESLAPESWAILNADDPYAPRMARGCQARALHCTLQPPAADAPEDAPETRIVRATPVRLAPDHTMARFEGPWGSYEARLPLVGLHNVANTLQAIAAANAVTSQARTIAHALTRCPAPPGRLEPVRLTNWDNDPPLPSVLVDYAHTHDAMHNVLTALRPLCEGRLIVLFGCGGDRDRTKRPKMARVACELADRVFITADNPRTEDPDAILADILAGVPDARRPLVTVEPDRAKAIDAAIDLAAPRDVVLLAGKGHEDYQIIGRCKRHFDDRRQAHAALRRKQARLCPSAMG